MLTLNEEFHLPGAIKNVKDWAEEIFIVDSCSTDKTVDIALEQGVKIVQRPFTNFGDQWNFALERLPIKTPWTFKLDPDERLSNDLKTEISNLLQGYPKCCGYEIDRRLWFMGKPLHVLAPVLRLWKTGKCHFSDVIVNEHPLIDGPIGKLKGIMEHLDTPDLHHWWEKQNRYTTMRAIEIANGLDLSAKPKLFGNSLERRVFFIKAFFNVPFRYQIQWVYEMFFRGAWRDGWVGLTWVGLRINVRRLSELKIKEIRLRGRVPKIPKAPKGNFDSRVVSSPLQHSLGVKSNE
jgi:glycosyltransferase involved in cell wall biosynthesis